ncbi:hypothetical protein TPHA_0K00210 [Tetrapisispora phaffii CBS 4417]|uniref:Transcription factor STP1 n=1 Tax=Tetrapisispora phaffii (strain ATCC 24235 / CBS 4417 / NBRC 1672 / NRRL Y-8282 / UCD 70-5) TaxID=1071381 RepID=G8BZ27_TETPH|nr:hypothetical protein TPHA_0K00210 [Tetrapisispora phaffii CBS 4417]CCE65155.1 hypothetical protein TPHA_0K00210 [Tetrapisispora phaffii CBS 4417]
MTSESAMEEEFMEDAMPMGTVIPTPGANEKEVCDSVDEKTLYNGNQEMMTIDAKKFVYIPETPASAISGTPSSDMKSPSNRSVGSSLSLYSNQKTMGEFVCHYCDAVFRIRGYLTRHIKKHAIQKAFHCPFYNDSASSKLKCHTTGGFSRRDTYKAHLKIRHFMYPTGVKPRDRHKSSGYCSQCGEFFKTTERWVETHIESGNCKGLPEGYLKTFECEKKSGGIRMIKTSTGHSRFISTAQSMVDPKILLNKDALEAMAIVANNSEKKHAMSTKYVKSPLSIGSSKINCVKKQSLDERWHSEDKEKKVGEDYTDFISSLEPISEHTAAYSLNESNEKSSFKNNLQSVRATVDNTKSNDPHMKQTAQEAAQELDFLRFSYYENLNPLQSSTTAIINKEIAALYDIKNFSNVPLDLEQCPIFNKLPDNKEPGQLDRSTDKQTIEPDLDYFFVGSLESNSVAEKQLKENEKYLNFYNYMFGSEL